MPPLPGSFVRVIEQAEDGNLVADLTEKFTALVETMRHQASVGGGKPTGKIGLTLTLKLDGGIFEVVADVGVTLPKTIRQRSIYFLQPDGTVSANNGRQGELPMDAPRDVSSTAAGSIRAIR